MLSQVFQPLKRGVNTGPVTGLGLGLCTPHGNASLVSRYTNSMSPFAYPRLARAAAGSGSRRRAEVCIDRTLRPARAGTSPQFGKRIRTIWRVEDA